MHKHVLLLLTAGSVTIASIRAMPRAETENQQPALAGLSACESVLRKVSSVNSGIILPKVDPKVQGKKTVEELSDFFEALVKKREKAIWIEEEQKKEAKLRALFPDPFKRQLFAVRILGEESEKIPVRLGGPVLQRECLQKPIKPIDPFKLKFVN